LRGVSGPYLGGTLEKENTSIKSGKEKRKKTETSKEDN